MKAMSGSQRGFGGFGRQSMSPQEHKYLSISRTGVRASGAVGSGTSGGGKRSRRSSSVSSAALAAAAASAAGSSSVSAMDSVTTPATQRTHYVMRTSGRKSHSKKHVSDRSGMDVSASVETSGSATASASAATEFTEGDSVMDNAAGMVCIDNDRDGEQSSGMVALQQKERIEELQRELEEVKKERDAAQKLAEERLRNCEALQAEAEALRQRYFNALCLAVKLDGRRGNKDVGKSDVQQLHLGSQQELYDMAKSKSIPVDEYPAWVAANIDTQL